MLGVFPGKYPQYRITYKPMQPSIVIFGSSIGTLVPSIPMVPCMYRQANTGISHTPVKTLEISTNVVMIDRPKAAHIREFPWDFQSIPVS